MKQFVTNLFFLFFLTSLVFGQSSGIPSVDIKTLDEEAFNTASIDNDGKPIIISFWATWCKPCIKELKTIQKVYKSWNEETGVKLIAISIDDERTKSGVKPFVQTTGWEWEVYTDANADFKRAMNVVNVPHTFLLDGNKKIVSQHTSFAPGDEQHLYEQILGLVGKSSKVEGGMEHK